MPFDPSSLLTLKHDRKSVVVPRNHCSSYDVSHSFLAFPVAFNFRDVLSFDCTVAKQGTIAIAQRNFPSLRPFAPNDLVFEAFIPDYHDKSKKKEVEVSKEAWPLVSAAVQSVTAIESGASQFGPRLFLMEPTCLLLRSRVAV
jgi:hypothetical protein